MKASKGLDIQQSQPCILRGLSMTFLVFPQLAVQKGALVHICDSKLKDWVFSFGRHVKSIMRFIIYITDLGYTNNMTSSNYGNC